MTERNPQHFRDVPEDEQRRIRQKVNDDKMGVVNVAKTHGISPARVRLICGRATAADLKMLGKTARRHD